MDRFDSCYFCGESFDASLSEYPVVPTALQPAEDSPTVVLCGTCRRKLGAVVEEVVSAASGDGTGEATTTTRRDAPTETDDATAVESGGDSLFDDADAATTDTDDSTVTTADEWESPATDDDHDSDTRNDEAATTSEEDSAATAPASDDAGDDAATPDDDTSGSEPTLTKLEYNKVMRLLQNRQFPVDRGEIREVATSAYDIDPQEFDAVIEAAVSRDLIGVENGQFVDPE